MDTQVRENLVNGSKLDLSDFSGTALHRFATQLFPICRSLSGPGVRQTLAMIRERLPDLEVREMASGMKFFDWRVPDEWTIRDAYVVDPQGERVIDFKTHNLHIVGYSEPVDTTLSLDELQDHLFSLPDQPDAIPYVTSYYSRSWGFCLRHVDRLRLRPGAYRVRIDSDLSPGVLNYGEVLIPGESCEEVLLSTYVCHPSMGNNEVSGPVVTTFLGQWLASLPRRRFSYRLVFVPETIGSIVYLSRNLEALKRDVVAGYVVTCVGDDRCYSYLASRLGNTLADRAALSALSELAPGFRRYSFLDRGSDERQYCSPGVDLPVALVMRSKYEEYPEYHTSLDDLRFITPTGLLGGFTALKRCIETIESNRTYKVDCLCEPQLGKRGLYANLSSKGSADDSKTMMDLIAYCDGDHDLLAIADRIGAPFARLEPIVEVLQRAKLLSEVPRGGVMP